MFNCHFPGRQLAATQMYPQLEEKISAAGGPPRTPLGGAYSFHIVGYISTVVCVVCAYAIYIITYATKLCESLQPAAS